MVEGKVEIYLSLKEPEKNLLWLRPYLDKDGYELLYFGANGWTPLICNHHTHVKMSNTEGLKTESNDSIVVNEVLKEIPDRVLYTEGDIYEITPPSLGLPETPRPSCGCPT